MTVRETLDFSARCQGIGSRAETMTGIIRREKEAGIVPDLDIDTYMKAKPDANLSGTKRKAVTPPTVGAGFLPLIDWKKPKEEWSCAICQVCPICLSNSKDMAFGCGHQTCRGCGQDLQLCPICRSPIQILCN